MAEEGPCNSYQIQHRDFHHTLVEVCGSVLDHLDSNHLLCLQVLTFHHLSESALTEHIEDQISVPEPEKRWSVGNNSRTAHQMKACILVTCLFRAENVIDVEDIIAVLVIEAVILDAFARFGQNSTRIARRLVFEVGVTYPVCRGEMSGQRL